MKKKISDQDFKKKCFEIKHLETDLHWDWQSQHKFYLCIQEHATVNENLNTENHPMRQLQAA